MWFETLRIVNIKPKEVNILATERYQITESKNAYNIIDTESKLKFNIMVQDLESMGNATFYCKIFNRIYQEGCSTVK